VKGGENIFAWLLRFLATIGGIHVFRGVRSFLKDVGNCKVPLPKIERKLRKFKAKDLKGE